MYIAFYVFYKISYPEPGESYIHSVEMREFGSPQEENSVTRQYRLRGYKTLRVNEQIYRLLLAVNNKEENNEG